MTPAQEMAARDRKARLELAASIVSRMADTWDKEPLENATQLLAGHSLNALDMLERVLRDPDDSSLYIRTLIDTEHM